MAASYTVTVTAETQVALTVFNIRRDRISEVESIVLDPTTSGGTADTGPKTIGTNVARIIIQASVAGSTGTVTVTQNGKTWPAATLAPDASITFDVA